MLPLRWELLDGSDEDAAIHRFFFSGLILAKVKVPDLAGRSFLASQPAPLKAMSFQRIPPP